MNRVNYVALIVVAIIAFIASSIWYSPLLFGKQFLALSGMNAPSPSPIKAACELLRTFILAWVIAKIVLGLNLRDWKSALRLGILLWIGFPVILLTGSMLWQAVPWQLAAIHAGDWLIKLVLIPITAAVWRRKAQISA